MAKRGRPPGSGGYPEDDEPVIDNILEIWKTDLDASVAAAYRAARREAGKPETETQLKRIRRQIRNLSAPQEEEAKDRLENDESESWELLTDPTFQQYLTGLEPRARAAAMVRRQELLKAHRDSKLHYEALARLHNFTREQIDEALKGLRETLRRAVLRDTLKLREETGQLW